MTFGKIKGFPELHVLDSTDPAQIKAIEAKVDLKSTICIVSSKSGSTLEPNIYKQYFFERVKAKVGEKEAGNRFIAITDPGSKMQQVAEADKFRRIFMGVPSIGGRYSALSNFGMVPAAVMGLDVAKFLKTPKRWSGLVALLLPPIPTRASSWEPSWASPRITAETNSPSSLRRESSILERGSNN